MIDNKLLRAVCDNPPALHFWKGEWRSGGFGPAIRNKIVEQINAAKFSTWRAVETGAGLSTLLFVALGADKVTSIAPDDALRDRILKYLTEHDVDPARIDFRVGYSEDILPSLAAESPGGYDVGLIDGGHGWPTVFVDFCYVGKLLRSDAMLMVDDTQLYSVSELENLLMQQPEYKFVHKAQKLAFFRKATKENFLPDFGRQPYILKKSKLQPPAPNAGSGTG